MPATVGIIHATDFIKATAEGELDLEESKRLLVEIASATDLADCEVILDTRKVHSSLSAADLWHFAAALGSVREALPRKTAVLCPRERFDHAAFFSLCAQCRGFKVRAFTSYEDAIDWLISNEPDPGTVPGGQGSAR
ncbi:MAG: hypothetical protein NTU94_04135 [Planctomycetota bacterium]|nr:hypothetical protein [Planctomycetota bacterium]